MSAHRIGPPSVLKRRLQDSLPRQHGLNPVVRVTARDQEERRCAAYAADHYEVQAFYTTTDPDSLDLLEKALRAFPRCTRRPRYAIAVR